MDANERRGVTPGVVVGLLIVAAGTLWFLDQWVPGISHQAWRFFWPVALLVVGLTKLGCSRHNGRVWGGLLTVFGILLLLDQLGYIEFSWGQIWPLFVIAIGLGMVTANWFRHGGGRP